MKKTILIGFLFLSCTVMFGQKNKMNAAYNNVMGEAPNLESAWENIEAAMEDPTTKDDAKTWYTAGLIYEKMIQEEQKKAALGNEPDRKKIGESAMKAHDYFVKAYELDQLPNEKGKIKPRFSKNIISYMKSYPNEFINYGVIEFQEQNYDEAITAWEKYQRMVDIPFLAGTVTKDSTYYMIGYNASLAAMLSENTDVAIKHLEEIKDEYNTDESYQYLAQQYMSKADTVNYFNTIKSGYEKYPTNTVMLRSLIDYYLNMEEDIDKAFLYINDAIKMEANVPDFYYIRGVIYAFNKDDESAFKDFQKTLELDPNNLGALYEMGGYYIRKGDAQMNIADNIRDMKLAKVEEDKANEIYKQAVEYLERVRALQKDNVNNLKDLRSLYYKIYRSDKHPKYIEITNEINGLY